MEDVFTPQAQAKWDAVPPSVQNKLLANVWCTHCSSETTIINYRGKVSGKQLVLTGECITCHGEVARVIEEV